MEKQRLKKMIIFDLDGTLWDTMDCTYEFIKDFLKEKNLPYVVTKETVKNNMGNNLSGCAEGYFPQLEKEKREKLITELFQYENKRLHQYSSDDILYLDVTNTIKELSKKYQIGIVSNCADEEYIENFIRISKTKDFILDYIPASKYNISKGEAIKRLMKKHQIEESVYVGDTLKDQAASKESNIPFIWAKYGYGTGIQAEYEMNKITEIKKVLERILEE